MADRLEQSTGDTPTILHHAHDGGTIHNHERYAMADMGAPGIVHAHAYRADWQPTLSPFVRAALTGKLPPKVLA